MSSHKAGPDHRSCFSDRFNAARAQIPPRLSAQAGGERTAAADSMKTAIRASRRQTEGGLDPCVIFYFFIVRAYILQQKRDYGVIRKGGKDFENY